MLRNMCEPFCGLFTACRHVYVQLFKIKAERCVLLWKVKVSDGSCHKSGHTAHTPVTASMLLTDGAGGGDINQLMNLQLCDHRTATPDPAS